MLSYIYSPVVKGKSIDLKSLNSANSHVRSLTKALVDVSPVPDDKTVDQHIEKTVTDILSLSSDVNIFVDFYGFFPGQTDSNGESAVIASYRNLWLENRALTPVYGFGRDENLWQRFCEVVDAFNSGFCFRIEYEDLDDEAENTWENILVRSAALRLQPSQIDLFIDLRDIRNSNVDELQDIVTDFLALQPQGISYRSICVAGSSASKDVTVIARDTVGSIYRNELKLWARLKSDVPKCRDLIYGDYGIVHPNFMGGIPCGKTVNCKIRYTAGDKIFIFRGHVRSGDSLQTHALARLLVNHEIYRGRDFSDGDEFIYKCAAEEVGPGNPGSWVFADLNHHLVYAALQIERLNFELEVDSSEEEIDSLLIEY
ncbi:beta family protein [Janthinobacterium sp. NFX145]|uniref:beta family protein n=1 Tax=Janthinobacterium sp. NFX145 TaxID=3415602 RepID=UPI003CC51883